jgi:Flp pilus assembly protein TadG
MFSRRRRPTRAVEDRAFRMSLLMIENLIAGLRRCWSGRNEGAAAVEFAITVPLLIVFVLGAVDYGILMNNAASLIGATRAGGEVAKVDPGVTAAQLTALGIFPSGATPSVSAPFCTCFDNTTVSCPAPGGAGANPCAAKSDTRVLRYVTVSATQSFSPLLSWTSLTFPGSLDATTVVRTQ